MHPCQKCDFWDGKCEYETVMGCKLPCMPGTTCHFNPIQPVQPKDYDKVNQSLFFHAKKKGNSLSLKDAMRMWKKGYSDQEIANACNVSVSTVRGWRKKNGLAFNKKLKFQESEALKMYHMGYSDYKIADACNVSTTCIQLWRKRKQLKANHKFTRQKNAAPKARGLESGKPK